MVRYPKIEVLKFREDSAGAEYLRRIAAERGMSLSSFIRLAARKEAGLVATDGPQISSSPPPVPPPPPLTPVAQNPSDSSPCSRALAFAGAYLKISQPQHERFAAAFPLLNIHPEYHRMDSWLAANPGRRKKNQHRFAHSWLSKEEEKRRGGPPRGPRSPGPGRACGETDYAAIAESRKKVIGE